MRVHSSKRLILWSFALAVGLAGCASSGGGGSRSGSPSRLTMANFTDDVMALDLYQAIQRLRPAWLRARGTAITIVYIDGTRRGRVEELQSIRVDQVQEVERLTGPDATMRFGTGNDGGAILVTLRR